MGIETAKPAKLRWRELEDEDGEDLDFLLSPKQVIGPNEHGVKKLIEYKFKEGDKVKVTTTTRTREIANACLTKRALELRNWNKFGDAVNEEAGSRLTVVSPEEIVLERPGTKQEVKKGTGELKLCRTCGQKGDHFTVMCPYKDLAPEGDSLLDKPGANTVAPGEVTKDAYVPPSMRSGAERQDGSDMRRRNEENSVRVTNLSEDTKEPDLQELFRPFGAVSCVYVAIDRKTNVSRGFGFVNFVNKEDAQRAINKLNGYGYDNLILRVEWAAPRN